MKTHLFVPSGGRTPSALPEHVTGSVLPGDVAGVADAIDAALSDPQLEVLVFWDPRLGLTPWSAITRFEASLDDVWHPGSRLTGGDQPDLLSYVQPLSIYRLDPAPDVRGAVNWKLDVRAMCVRADAFRRFGNLDRNFDTLEGATRELGYRFIRRGAICRQRPDLLPADRAAVEGASLADRYRLLRRHFSNVWSGYSLVRRIMQGNPPASELRAWRQSAKDRAPIPQVQSALTFRDLASVQLPKRPSVTVVLPTFGRYRYLAEVLDDLRAQTVAPTQILVADGNPPEEREPEVYERYRDLPIEVLFHEEKGICSGRNACLRRATGDFVWFVDDDSRFDADNLEAHLRVLAAYGADVSVGPAFTKSRPELHGIQREIVCTHMDCGTTLCRRSLLAQVGSFDMQFNEYLAGEDGELGIRFIQAGGLMVNNPFAKRFHYLAPVGGSRSSKRSVHRFTRWSRLPRPVQSIYYTARRYFEPSVVGDAMFMACLLAGWRRREGVPATRSWRLKTLLGELFAVPATAYRLRESVLMGRAMVDEGPLISPLTERDEHPRSRKSPST